MPLYNPPAASGAPTNNPTFTTKISTPKIKGTGSTPAAAVGGGAGAGATVSIVGTDLAGTVTVNAGTGTLVDGTAVTITFNVPYSTAPYVAVSPSDNVTSGAKLYVGGSTTTSFDVGLFNIEDEVTYTFTYAVIQ